MSWNAAAAITTVLAAPINAVPVSLAIHSALQPLRPKSKLKKWNIRVEQISATVVSKGDMITPKEMEKFFKVLELYKSARDSLRQKIKDGKCTWYGKGKGYADDFSDIAREVWDTGMSLSTEASSRKAQSYFANNVQPSVEQMPTTSTSLVNKGKSRQTSSLSEESPLKNGLHSKKSLDTAKSSVPSTSDSSSCLPNELPSSSLPTLYSEAVINKGAMSLNSEDDSEDDSADSDSDTIAPKSKDLEKDITEDDSDSDSNSMTSEEVGFVYDLWRRIPEEKSAWASMASLRDEFKRQGVITTQKSQH